MSALYWGRTVDKENSVCVVCRKPIPSGEERFRRRDGQLHIECDQRWTRWQRTRPAATVRLIRLK